MQKESGAREEERARGGRDGGRGAGRQHRPNRGQLALAICGKSFSHLIAGTLYLQELLLPALSKIFYLYTGTYRYWPLMVHLYVLYYL
jgi:hypothetical protein